jgi:hypothetical protein
VSALSLTACCERCLSRGPRPAVVSPRFHQALVFNLTPPEARVPAEGASIQALPTFHAAPVILEEPADTDAADPAASVLQAHHAQAVPAALAALSTQRLSLDAL